MALGSVLHTQIDCCHSIFKMYDRKWSISRGIIISHDSKPLQQWTLYQILKSHHILHVAKVTHLNMTSILLIKLWCLKQYPCYDPYSVNLQAVSCCKVPMHKSFVSQIVHSSCNISTHLYHSRVPYSLHIL